MLNKKTHIALAVLLMVALLLCATITIDGNKFSLLSLMGLEVLNKIILQATLITVCVAVIIIISMHRKICKQFYILLFRGQYDFAAAFLDKYYSQNKGMFFPQYLFLAFSVGNIDAVNSICRKFGANKFRGRALIAKTYKCLIDFLTDSPQTIETKFLLDGLQKQMKKNQNMILLISALESFKKSEYLKSKKFIEYITPSFYYASLAIVIYKIESKVNLALNQDNTKTIEKMQLIANNDFLRSLL